MEHKVITAIALVCCVVLLTCCSGEAALPLPHAPPMVTAKVTDVPIPAAHEPPKETAADLSGEKESTPSATAEKTNPSATHTIAAPPTTPPQETITREEAGKRYLKAMDYLLKLKPENYRSMTIREFNEYMNAKITEDNMGEFQIAAAYSHLYLFDEAYTYEDTEITYAHYTATTYLGELQRGDTNPDRPYGSALYPVSGMLSGDIFVSGGYLCNYVVINPDDVTVGEREDLFRLLENSLGTQMAALTEMLAAQNVVQDVEKTDAITLLLGQGMLKNANEALLLPQVQAMDGRMELSFALQEISYRDVSTGETESADLFDVPKR